MVGGVKGVLAGDGEREDEGGGDAGLLTVVGVVVGDW
jgi:hypothetical protein